MTIGIKTLSICVIGAGYVGLPLSREFSRSYRVISFDTDNEKIRRLSELNEDPDHVYSSDPRRISESDYIAVCVPTPLLARGNKPDMSYIKNAAATVGQHMKKGATVIIESSVYPGATEELIRPILERTSGYACGTDFKLAYSPERINPGDSAHGIGKVTKIVAAGDPETLEEVADLYRHITPNIFKASNIRTAEAAKLLENTQRDLNIALINELSILFRKMGLKTQDVLEAAATKWNFLSVSPGLVGGYCIPVVPNFFMHKAGEYGCHLDLVSAARSVNDAMPKRIARMTIESLSAAGTPVADARVLIIGCSYKENVADTRATPVRELVRELQDQGAVVYGFDPLIGDSQCDLGIEFIKTLAESPKMDCAVVAVLHDILIEILPYQLPDVMKPGSTVIDIKGALGPDEFRRAGIKYECL